MKRPNRTSTPPIVISSDIGDQFWQTRRPKPVIPLFRTSSAPSSTSVTAPAPPSPSPTATSPAAQLASQNLRQQHQDRDQRVRLQDQEQQRQKRQLQLLQQQQTSQPQQQHAPPMNGVNGANMAVGGMPGPSPAGHQAELNYIYSMVEELSKQLAENRRVTEDIVSGLGRVRTRARTQGQGNDELINSASEDINGQQENLDSLISVLSESLEKAKYSRDANAALLTQYAQAFTVMLKQVHEYKTKHVADVALWHRSYRSQLDDARRENSRLREQIWEMQAHASVANEQLRKFRAKYDEDEERWKRRVDDKAARQELRFWKRMAMPELEDDDSYWSDDDDVVDPAEKERLAEMERRALQEQGAESPGDEDGEEHPHLRQEHLGGLSLMGMGGVPMQRGESQQQQQQGLPPPPGQGMPVPPPRPGSAASSTGSTGP